MRAVTNPFPLPGGRTRFFVAARRRHAFAELVRAIRSLNIAEVTSVEAADLYRGKNVAAGKYSLIIRVTFQSREATLTDAQVSEFSSKLLPRWKPASAPSFRSS